jgi:hypothetical protein
VTCGKAPVDHGNQSAVYTVSADDVCPGHGRGLLLFRGVQPLDVATPYLSDTGQPLVTAPQLADIRGVKTRTIYQWVRRGRIEVVGLGDNGEQLFDANDVAALTPAA